LLLVGVGGGLLLIKVGASCEVKNRKQAEVITLNSSSEVKEVK
jgi:hypothetical protein